VAGNIAAIAGAVSAFDWLAIKFGEQDVGDRMEDRFGRAFQEVGQAGMEFSLAQPDRVVDRNKRIKTNMQRRRGRVGTQFAIGFEKDFGELRRHVEGRVARLLY
jgi:hypothetical protein